MKYFIYEIFYLWNILYMKCPIYEMSFYEMSQRRKDNVKFQSSSNSLKRMFFSWKNEIANIKGLLT